MRKGRYLLKKAVDDTKDQSYVLYMLTEHACAFRSLRTAQEVRVEIAEENGFVNAVET